MKGLISVAIVGMLVIGLGITTGSPTAIGMAIILTVTLLVFAVHSAWKMASGLAAFAQAVPFEPSTRVSIGGARLDWPSLSLSVEGRAGVLREPDLQAVAAGEPMAAPADEGSQLARQALDVLGFEAPGTDPPGSASGK